MKHFLIVILLSLILVNCQKAQVVSEDITVDELRTHVEYLASDELEGRKPGSEGIKKAAAYIKNQLDKLQLNPIDGKYLQTFEIVTDIKAGENNKLEFNGFVGKMGEDFTPLAISETAELKSKVVFVGYGFDIDEDSLKWNDYKDVDVRDKWVMILRGSPATDSHDDPYQNYSSLRKKILSARDKKAGGVIFVSGTDFDNEDILLNISYSSRETPAGLPAIHLKRNVADKLLSDYDASIEELEVLYKEEKIPYSVELEIELYCYTDIEKIKAKTSNVTAILEGNDPLLKDEYIFIGAHYDHLGYGGKGSGSRSPDTVAIHNGADDNASGTSAIIEIMERLALNRDNIKRSVIFMAFSAEEMGLLGSKYFTNNPFVELNKIKFMVNLDMVGRLNQDTKNLTIGGTGTAIGLEDIIKNYSDKSGLNVKLNSEGYGPSDHAAFYAKDIPVAFVFTGLHEDYHLPEDDAHLLNYEGQKEVADLIYNITFEIANLSEALAYQEAGPKEPKQTYKRFKVTLGIMPDVASTDIKGLRADAVIEGRPAYRAGMKKGDIIVAMEGKEVNDIYDYMNRLSEFKPGQRISVDVIRGNEKVILIVEL
ncbi:M28 family peptidase [Bacteroidota bacterium]